MARLCNNSLCRPSSSSLLYASRTEVWVVLAGRAGKNNSLCQLQVWSLNFRLCCLDCAAPCSIAEYVREKLDRVAIAVSRTSCK